MSEFDFVQAQKECDDWNADVSVGMPVTVRRDDGTLLETRTRSKAWVMCEHPSVLVEGISGSYALERVTLRQRAVPAYCAQCSLNGSGNFAMREERCTNYYCVFYVRELESRPDWLVLPAAARRAE